MTSRLIDISWLEEPLWELQILPSIAVQLKEEQFPKMKEIIEETIENTELQSARNRVRDEAWQKRGKAALEVYDYLINELDKIENN